MNTVIVHACNYKPFLEEKGVYIFHRNGAYLSTAIHARPT